MTEPKDVSKAGEAMGEMEASIEVMQEDIAGSLAPVRHHFRPWWLFMAILVAAAVGGSAYLGATQIARVPDNVKAIDRSCEQRNEQIKLMNKKFNQLNVLFDASLAEPRTPGERPPSEEILRLYREFKTPIPLVSCKDFLGKELNEQPVQVVR